MDAILAEIERSRGLLELQDDWDGEGSCAYSLEVWERATSLLKASAEAFIASGGKNPSVPIVWIGPHGSVDIFWRLTQCELLMNVPPDLKEPASFYGDGKDGQSTSTVSGNLRNDEPAGWLLWWLQEQEQRP